MKVIKDMLSRNGKISNAKVWAFIGSAVSTWIMIYMTIKDKMGWELFVAYLASVAGFSQVSKLIAYRYGSAITTTTTTEDAIEVKKCVDCTSKSKTDEGSD